MLTAGNRGCTEVGCSVFYLRSTILTRFSHSIHSFVCARRGRLRLSAELSAHGEALGRLGGDVWHLSGAAVVAVGLFRRWYRCVSLTTGSRVGAFARSCVHAFILTATRTPRTLQCG